MGIRTSLSSVSSPIFSENVLKIEICGPDEDNLTVIDVPGIFRNHTEGVTTKQDIELVNSLVKKYIEDHRTIILAVLPSNVDIATQEILDLAKTYDKNGERTLGILTKPDLVTESASKMSVFNLVSGSRKPLSLGYYIVRNRGADDDTIVQHEALELMFQCKPWSDLPPDRVGIQALKARLAKLLSEIARREFPNLRKDVKSKLKKCQDEVDSIGPVRGNEKEQRRFLCDIARKFEELTRSALISQYSYHELFQIHNTRLITCLVNLTDVFRSDFQWYGQSRHFEEIGAEAQAGLWDKKDGFKYHNLLLDHFRVFGTGEIDDCAELDSILNPEIIVQQPNVDIMRWIKQLNIQSRGMNLGTFSPEMLAEFFTDQSRQWPAMVEVYMNEVVRLIHHFMIKALNFICPDEDITKNIWSAILEPVLQKYKSGVEQALLLVEIERNYTPFTLNSSFNQEVQSARAARVKEMLKKKAWISEKYQNDDRFVVNLEDVAQVATAQTNAQYLEEEIHDKLKSYYHLAADRTMDNLFRHAVYYHLLKGPSSPLQVFSPTWVLDLDDDKLKAIAGEKEAAKKRRRSLNKNIKDLKSALDILD